MKEKEGQEKLPGNIATADEVQEFITAVMRDETGDYTKRLKAAELMCKVYGLFREQKASGLAVDWINALLAEQEERDLE